MDMSESIPGDRIEKLFSTDLEQLIECYQKGLLDSEQASKLRDRVYEVIEPYLDSSDLYPQLADDIKLGILVVTTIDKELGWETN